MRQHPEHHLLPWLLLREQELLQLPWRCNQKRTDAARVAPEQGCTGLVRDHKGQTGHQSSRVLSGVCEAEQAAALRIY